MHFSALACCCSDAVSTVPVVCLPVFSICLVSCFPICSERALLQVNVQQGSNAPYPPPDDPYSHFYCISPDAPTNAVLFWMGSYDNEAIKFRLSEAVGPYRLDMGDTIYAPNIFEDSQVRFQPGCALHRLALRALVNRVVIRATLLLFATSSLRRRRRHSS
jgi:hypothetical protein